MLRGADTIELAQTVPLQANPFPCPFQVEGRRQRPGGLPFLKNLLLAHPLLSLRLLDKLAGDVHTAEESAEVPC
jgi:hypothetical protein